MNFTEFQQEMERAQSAYDNEISSLELRIEKRRRALQRDEKKLAEIREGHKHLVQQLALSLAGIIPESEIAATNSTEQIDDRDRQRRGSLDEPVERIVNGVDVGVEFTTTDIAARWAAQYPDNQVRRSTIRGVLERLVKQGKLRVTHEGGRGSANPRRYAIRQAPQQETLAL